MSKRGKASDPKSGSGNRPRPSKSRKAHKPQSSGNGQPRTANKDTTLLLRKKEVREDIKLLQTALTNRWPVPQAKRPTIVRRLINIVRKTIVPIVTKKGEVIESEGAADINSVLAARALIAMEGQNQKDDFRGEPETKHEHQHIHIHGNGNGEQPPVDPEAEARRARLLELAANLRARDVVIDGVRVEPTPAGRVDRAEPTASSLTAGEGNQ